MKCFPHAAKSLSENRAPVPRLETRAPGTAEHQGMTDVPERPQTLSILGLQIAGNVKAKESAAFGGGALNDKEHLNPRNTL